MGAAIGIASQDVISLSAGNARENVINLIAATSTCQTLWSGIGSFSAAISACEKVEQWQQPLPLFHKMRNTGMISDVISQYLAATLACEEEVQWEQSFGLLDKVRELGMIATVISFNNIPPCEEGRAVGASSDTASQDARR